LLLLLETVRTEKSPCFFVHSITFCRSFPINPNRLYPTKISNFCPVKTTRLTQAKEEAEKEAGLYRSNLESEYQKRVGEVWLDITSATSIPSISSIANRNYKEYE
jgi:hypothetical protein